ncbi:MAG: class I SAM-dependent methyltransferase [Legionella sp.]|nr:class I SAM-dependent methyltransferase [Legionella sp.]
MCEINNKVPPGTLTIGYQSNKFIAKAEEIAKRLSLTLDNNAPNQLLVSDRLFLKLENLSPISLSFIEEFPHLNKVANAGIIRACRPRPGLKILDATAGWGKDAFLLARFGADLTLLERHPVMACLLEHALEEYQQWNVENNHSALNISLYNQDAVYYLERLSSDCYPDIIYLDPMHPTRKKAALVKNKMQVLQKLIFNTKTGMDHLACLEGTEEIRNLIQLARQKVTDCVIVKWPQRSLAVLPPHSSTPGKTVRFDRYMKLKPNS